MDTTSHIAPIVPGYQFLGQLQSLLRGGSVPVALALTDLDDFGEVNRRHGHQAGDRVLAGWQQVLEANLPAGGGLFRLGGDEFAVALPGLSAEGALILLEGVRSHFASHSPVAELGVSPRASVGVAANPPHGRTGDELWRASGDALMRAKREGRDRVAIYVEEKMVLKSNYYNRGALDRLARLSSAAGRTEASLLREALEDVLQKYREKL